MLQNKHYPNLSLILGGTRSGKSAMAEKIALASGLAPVYLATAQSGDNEMAKRIAIHKKRRDGNWRLIEEPVDLAHPISTIKQDEILLIDCLTLWLSNSGFSVDQAKINRDNLMDALLGCAGKVICVSNELGMGIVPENQISRSFRDAQGMLNQTVAELADLVVFSVAGLPVLVKGTIPEPQNER